MDLELIGLGLVSLALGLLCATARGLLKESSRTGAAAGRAISLGLLYFFGAGVMTGLLNALTGQKDTYFAIWYLAPAIALVLLIDRFLAQREATAWTLLVAGLAMGGGIYLNMTGSEGTGGSGGGSARQVRAKKADERCADRLGKAVRSVREVLQSSADLSDAQVEKILTHGETKLDGCEGEVVAAFDRWVTALEGLEDGEIPGERQEIERQEKALLQSLGLGTGSSREGPSEAEKKRALTRVASTIKEWDAAFARSDVEAVEDLLASDFLAEVRVCEEGVDRLGRLEVVRGLEELTETASSIGEILSYERRRSKTRLSMTPDLKRATLRNERTERIAMGARALGGVTEETIVLEERDLRWQLVSLTGEVLSCETYPRLPPGAW